MNDHHYMLDWRGTQRGPEYRRLQTRLEAGEINSLHSIHVDGKWVVLREFLNSSEQQVELARKQAQAAALTQPPSHLIQQIDQPTEITAPASASATTTVHCFTHSRFSGSCTEAFQTAGGKLWIMLISMSALVIILAAVAGGYLFANRGSGSAPSATEALDEA